MFDPVTGPFTRQQFQELVSAPYGEALKKIREVDPYLGIRPGEKIRFRVTGSARLQGVAFIQAESIKQAQELADKLGEHDFDWGGYGCSDVDIVDVEPDAL